MPIKIDAAGFGCFVTHRDVFAAMQKPYFKNHFFTPVKEVSEDFYFCIKARQLGFDIWAVPELKCGHIAQGKAIYSEDFVMPENKQIAECLVSVARQSVA